MALRDAFLEELTIDDDAVFSGIALYRGLKRHLAESSHRFRVADSATPLSWDRALFLNLTFWSPQDGADVLCDDHVPADVLAHVALHHIVNAELAKVAGDTVPSPAALFFGESIASAFDLYLVGRLIVNAPHADFIVTQLPIMAEAAEQAGLSEGAFAQLIDGVAHDPERAFEDMRVLLFDVSMALHGCAGVNDALAILTRHASHRFASLLHHCQLSNWILYARAHAKPDAAQDDAVRNFDAALRRAPCSLDLLAQNWVQHAD
jgi:hypothetical protein